MAELIEFPGQTLEVLPPALRAAFTALDAVGVDKICADIENGLTLTEIASVHEVSVSQLMRWCSADPNRAKQVNSSRVASAEAWMDRGFRYLANAAPDPVEMVRAKELAAHCRKMAGLRDLKFSDKGAGTETPAGNDKALNVNDVARRVAFILQKARQEAIK